MKSKAKIKGNFIISKTFIKKLKIDFTKMNSAEKIKRIISALHIGTKAEFARIVGITPQNLNYWIQSDFIDVDKVKIAFPNLNGDWLLTGTGEMINSTSGANSPVVNNAGDGNNFFTRDKKDCEQILAAKDELISQLRGEVDYLRNLTTTLMSK